MIRVRLGFGSTWQTDPASIDWTDITNRVLDRRTSINVRRGATSAFGEVDAGQGKFLLRNHDRMFDPAYVDGPFFGQLLAGVPVSIVDVGDEADIAYPDTDFYPAEDVYPDLPVRDIFTGFVSAWPQRFSRQDGFIVTPISAVDGFAKVAEANVPGTYVETIVDDATSLLFPMGDEGLEWSSQTATRLGSYNRPASSGRIVTPRGLAYPATVFDGSYRATVFQRRQGAMMLAHIDPTQVTVGQYLTLYELGQEQPQVSIGAVVDQFWLGIEIVSTTSRTCRIIARTYQASMAQWTDVVSGTFSYAEPFTIGWARYRVSIGAGESFVVYRNGVEVAFPTGSTTSDVSAGYIAATTSIGGAYRGGAQHAGFAGSIAQVILGLYEPNASPDNTHLVTDAFAAAYHAAIMTARAGEHTGQRIDWLLDLHGWPAGARNIADGRSRVGPVTGDGSKALGYIRKASTTEAGRVFVAADGSFTFHDRWRRWLDPAATTPQIDITGASGVYFADLDRDPQSTDLMANRVEVTPDNALAQTAQDTASIAAHGERTEQVSTMHYSQLSARGLAQFIVNTRGLPLDLVDTVRIPVHGLAEADRDALLALDLGDRVELTHNVSVGDPVTLEVLVAGIEHDVSGASTDWICELYLEPAPTRSLFLVGSSLVGGSDVVTH